MTTENKLNNRLLLKRQYIQMIEYKYKQLLYARPPKIFKINIRNGIKNNKN